MTTLILEIVGLTIFAILLFDAARNVFLVYHKRRIELRIGRYVTWERYRIFSKVWHFWEW